MVLMWEYEKVLAARSWRGAKVQRVILYFNNAIL